jgi:maltose alpha-D-glucosyltransferase/alpha-amylase
MCDSYEIAQLSNLISRELPPQLPAFLERQRWFGGKARAIHAVEIPDVIPMPSGQTSIAFLVLARVTYSDSAQEIYALPLMPMTGGENPLPALVATDPILCLSGPGEQPVALQDALRNKDFCSQLLKSILQSRSYPSPSGEISCTRSRALNQIVPMSLAKADLAPTFINREQSNTSIAFGDCLMLKFFRRLEDGINLDVEVGTFLTEHVRFDHVPQVAGGILYRKRGGQPVSLGFLQQFVKNQGDAWHYTLLALGGYFNRVIRHPEPAPAAPAGLPFSSLPVKVLRASRKLIGTYLDSAKLLGHRTAELHHALASGAENPDFAPEFFTPPYQESIFQSMKAQAIRSFQLLKGRLGSLSDAAKGQANYALSLEDQVLAAFHPVVETEFKSLRIRIHGDFHLGQVLCTETDFMIIDFEGEPAKPLAQRKIKKSALQDVAGMLRSFHYAAETALMKITSEWLAAEQHLEGLQAWAHYWQQIVSSVYLQEYRAVADKHPLLLPESLEGMKALLRAFQLEKALYELEYELNNRPDWVRVPLSGILQILRSHQYP